MIVCYWTGFGEMCDFCLGVLVLFWLSPQFSLGLDDQAKVKKNSSVILKLSSVSVIPDIDGSIVSSGLDQNETFVTLMSYCLMSSPNKIPRFRRSTQLIADWTRLKGNDVGNQHSVLPTKDGETDEQAKSHPGSRSGAGWWTDHLNGQIWMYGGKGYDGHPTEQAMALGDLWMFASEGNIWRCVNRGEKTRLSPIIPTRRHLAAVCGVHSIDLIVFGGEDEDGKVLSDTWIYDINDASWIPLDFKKSIPTPGPRKAVGHWCVRDKMIIFGGRDGNGHALKDMWQFSLQTLIWTNITLQNENKNSDITLLFPAGRSGPATWHAMNSSLYMFGGKSNENNYFSDLWIFHQKSAKWQIVHGTSKQGMLARSGTLGIGAAENCPGGREHSATWLDLQGNLWLFGGRKISDQQLSDLWQYNVHQNVWVLMENATLKSHPDKSDSHRSSGRPSIRESPASWSYKGIMYLYGGLGLDARNKTSQLNDLWVLTQGNATYLFSEEESAINKWFKSLPASTIFIAVLSTIGGIALTFGAVFYIKKMLEYPHHTPGSEYNVRYSPLTQEATLET